MSDFVQNTITAITSETTATSQLYNQHFDGNNVFNHDANNYSDCISETNADNVVENRDNSIRNAYEGNENPNKLLNDQSDYFIGNKINNDSTTIATQSDFEKISEQCIQNVVGTDVMLETNENVENDTSTNNKEVSSGIEVDDNGFEDKAMHVFNDDINFDTAIEKTNLPETNTEPLSSECSTQMSQTSVSESAQSPNKGQSNETEEHSSYKIAFEHETSSEGNQVIEDEDNAENINSTENISECMERSKSRNSDASRQSERSRSRESVEIPHLSIDKQNVSEIRRAASEVETGEGSDAEAEAAEGIEPNDSDVSTIDPDIDFDGDAILGPYSNEDANPSCDEEIDSENEQSDSEDENNETIIADQYVSTEAKRSAAVSHMRKRRRRILIYNDGESSDGSGEGGDILQSPSVSPSVASSLTENSNSENWHHSDEDSNDNIIMENERPGPRSRKESTKVLKEMEVRTLLKNAVIIPIHCESKRKKRVIDSADEISDNEADISSKALDVSLDDIGAGEYHDLCDNSEDETSVNYALVDDAPRIRVKNELRQLSDPNVKTETNENEVNKNYTKLIDAIKLEPICELREEKQTNQDSGNSTDSMQKQSQLFNQANQNIFDMSLNHPVFGESSESSDDGYIPNDEYFGQSKRINNPISRDSRKRSKYIGHTSSYNVDNSSDSSNSVEHKLHLNYSYNPKNINWNNFLPSSLVAQSQKKKKKKKHLPNELYFDIRVPLHVLHAYDESSSSDESQKPTGTNPTWGNNPMNIFKQYPPPPVPSNVQRLISQQQRKVQQQYRRPQQQKSQQKKKPPPQKRKSAAAKTVPKRRPSSVPATEYEDDLIKTMKSYLNAAGMKRFKLNRLWAGCSTSEERANRILNLLHEKGLEGEPTIEKCKQLRKDLQIRREIEGLDPNVIIQTEGGRTRRSTRTSNTPKYNYDDDDEPPAQLETLMKIRQIIDSDTESD